ncbi:hypothetical protein VTL71DRAFT_9508 [Oculimacula yallundae]|uniref:Alpha-1,4-glucan:maltose-1-phosphate maltosyltransferase C-terminal domain-containing protein n=1 Tax=Oculimacula yallundae TaxID=86028 RepID=A0ABR4BS33_9HELO
METQYRRILRILGGGAVGSFEVAASTVIKRKQTNTEYLNKRQQILNVERHCEELRYQILKVACDAAKMEAQPVLEELFLLQNVEAKSHRSLSCTKLEQITVNKIDRLISDADVTIEICLDEDIEHRDWLKRHPDGSIKYAENPPKKYEDVYLLNFGTPDRESLWRALLEVLTFWISHKREWPEVIFLSESFTSPNVAQLLAKLGFTQSYTYFTWLNHAKELHDYMQEICYTGMQEYFRPNFFTNTPDILPEILQTGGRPALQMRLVLAATLSPSYGIYSGFELCESAAVPGCEEYLNSEKYEIRVRNWNQPGNINDLVTKMNRIRAENLALQRLDNIHFFASENNYLLIYSKRHSDNILLIVVNLDPHNTHHGIANIPADFVGILPGGRYEVVDLLSYAVYDWGERNYFIERTKMIAKRLEHDDQSATPAIALNDKRRAARFGIRCSIPNISFSLFVMLFICVGNRDAYGRTNLSPEDLVEGYPAKRILTYFDDAKETSEELREELRDELDKKWSANHRSSVYPNIPAGTGDSTDSNSYDCDDEEEPNNQLLAEYWTSFSTTDNVYTPPSTSFQGINQSFVQIPDANSVYAPPHADLVASIRCTVQT